MRKAKRTLWIIPAILVLLYGFFCWNAALGYLSPLREVPPMPDGFAEVKVPTRFGPNPTWTLGDAEKANTAYILVHGYGGTRASWTPVAEELAQRGAYVAIPAMPAQDASPAKTVGFGTYESDVILETVKWIRSQPEAPSNVVVVGVSMGGAATWIAAKRSLEPGQPKIDGVVTDGGYAVFREAMDQFFDRKLPGGAVILRPVVWFAEAMSGLKSEAVRPLEAAAAWKGRPALVIQGEADTLIVPSHGKRLSKAAGCPLWSLPGVEHAESFEGRLPEYADRISSILP